jgi:NADH-quinone oxidoreductase subunit N
MSKQDIVSLLPMLLLAGGILLTMIGIAVKRNHRITFVMTLVVLAACFWSVLVRMEAAPHVIGELLVMDRFGYYYQALILLATAVVSVFSFISLRQFFPEKRKEEYYLLLMLATLGAAMMVVSAHFIFFFLSLEILTVSLYGLVGYYREREKAIEAGLKYLVLAAMSSAFILFGMALIYADSGTMSFAFAPLLPTAHSGLLLVAGLALMLVGIGFKLGLVPFHVWTPDVYEGASAPVSAFIATVSKGAVVALLLRFCSMGGLYQDKSVMLALTVIAALSMLAGNLLALGQHNIKRLLAYSSISHLGYVLVAVIAGKEMGPEAATFYITAYIVTILGAFGLVTLISVADGEAMDLDSYKGLFWRKPLLAAAFTVFLLSLAGIPLTAGFMGKYFLLRAGVGTGKWLLPVVLVTGSVIGLYYYLRVIVVMMDQEQEAVQSTRLPALSMGGGIVLAALSLAVVWLGIWPGWLIELINRLR